MKSRFMIALLFVCFLACIWLVTSKAQTVGQTSYPAGTDSRLTLINAANGAITTIATGGAINTTDTSVNVTAGSSFPTSGAITIDSEIIYYGARSGNQLQSLVRAREGTTAASHSAGATVAQRMTAGYHLAQSDAIVAVQTKWIGSLTGLVVSSGTSPVTGVTTSAGIASAIGNETGTDLLVFNTNPSIVGGALSGTFTGTPTFSGNLIFSGAPQVTGASFTAPIINKGNGTFDVKAYGAAGDGVADDTAEIQAAIDAAGAAGGGFVYFPEGTYLISSTLTVGNGSSTTISTYGGITLLGGGGVKTTDTSTVPGVKIKWNGTISTSNIMVKVLGPFSAFQLRGIHLDADLKAGIGLQIIHAQSASVEDISVFKYTNIGIDIDSFGLPTGGGASFNSGTESTGLYGDNGSVKNFLMVTSASNTVGIRLGATGTTANWHFERGQVREDSTTGSAGLELKFTDHCTFMDVVTSAESGILVKPILNAGSFPMNTSFYAGAYTGKTGSSVVNNPGTGIAAGATSIILTDASSFPTAGTGQIAGGLESFTWTGKSTNTLTGVTKGKYDTRDIAHADGVAVTVAMSITINETVQAWAPTPGYNGLHFNPFNTADGSVFPTSRYIRGVTDIGYMFGLTHLSIGANPNKRILTAGQTDLLHLQAPDSTNALVFIDNYAGVSGISFRGSPGTAATPTATQSTNQIGSFGGRGYQTTTGAFATTNNASIVFTAAENFTSTAQGMHIDLQTTSPGTASRAQRWRVDADGAFIGTPATASPTTTQLTSGSHGAIYVKGSKLIIAFNDGGTVRYKYLDLTGTGVTWVHTVSAP